jgi:DNA-binding GntR family transcriptional regulator
MNTVRPGRLVPARERLGDMFVLRMGVTRRRIGAAEHGLTPVRKLHRSNLSEAAYVAVKDVLLSPRYSPGERISVENMSRALGVSRTPVWDALNRLEAEGMVDIVPRRGVYLLNFSPGKTREIYLVREALEGMAAKLAAANVTEPQLEALHRALERQATCLAADDVDGYANATIKFHDLIVDAARNTTLARHLRTVYGQIQALRLRTLYLPVRLKASFEEHQRLFETLKERDTDAAEQAARHHIQTTMRDALDILAGAPAPASADGSRRRKRSATPAVARRGRAVSRS